jgi:hypothetical protein
MKNSMKTTPPSPPWGSQEILDALDLPEDDETVHRALAFQSLMRKAHESPQLTQILRTLYRVAAERPYELSLHDSNMLRYALAENPSVAEEIVVE